MVGPSQGLRGYNLFGGGGDGLGLGLDVAQAAAAQQLAVAQAQAAAVQQLALAQHGSGTLSGGQAPGELHPPSAVPTIAYVTLVEEAPLVKQRYSGELDSSKWLYC